MLTPAYLPAILATRLIVSHTHTHTHLLQSLIRSWQSDAVAVSTTYNNNNNNNVTV